MRKDPDRPLNLSHSYRRRRIKYYDSLISSSIASTDRQRGSQHLRLEVHLESIKGHI